MVIALQPRGGVNGAASPLGGNQENRVPSVLFNKAVQLVLND